MKPTETATIILTGTNDLGQVVTMTVAASGESAARRYMEMTGVTLEGKRPAPPVYGQWIMPMRRETARSIWQGFLLLVVLLAALLVAEHPQVGRKIARTLIHTFFGIKRVNRQA